MKTSETRHQRGDALAVCHVIADRVPRGADETPFDRRADFGFERQNRARVLASAVRTPQAWSTASCLRLEHPELAMALSSAAFALRTDAISPVAGGDGRFERLLVGEMA